MCETDAVRQARERAEAVRSRCAAAAAELQAAQADAAVAELDYGNAVRAQQRAEESARLNRELLERNARRAAEDRAAKTNAKDPNG